MSITPPITPPAPLRYSVLDLVTNASIEAGWSAPGEIVDGDGAGFIFSKINDLLDEWAAQKLYAYAMTFELFTLVPGTSPHLIGPDVDADFRVSQRPQRLEYAAIVLPAAGSTSDGSFGSGDFGSGEFGGGGGSAGNNNVDIPIYIGDADWWAAQSIKDLQNQIPTGVYLEPAWPNGKLFYWPVPDRNYQTRLEMWGILSQFALITQDFSMPPAYRKAITLSVAEELGGPISASPKLAKSAALARAAIKQNNDGSPRIRTSGSGMPGSRRGRPDFDFLTGKPW